MNFKLNASGSFKKIFLFIFFSLFIANADAGFIKVGTYTGSIKTEKIIISSDRIKFDLRPPNNFSKKAVARTYNFKLQKNGDIVAYGSSNDRFFVNYVLKFEWKWNGKSIIRTDTRKKLTDEFSISPANE